MTDSVKNWTIEELRAEVKECRAAIFAYEMSGDANRIDAANRRLDELFAELKLRSAQDCQ